MFMATEARRPVSSTSSVSGFWSAFSWRAPYWGGSGSWMVSMFFSEAMVSGLGLMAEEAGEELSDGSAQKQRASRHDK